MFMLFFADVSIFARPPFNTFKAAWFRQFSQKKTAVFGCLTNALAPPPVALESCSAAQTDRLV